MFLLPKQPEQQRAHTNDAAHRTDVWQTNMSAHHTTNEGACTNTEVEDARKDAHVYRCALGWRNIDNLALHSNIKGVPTMPHKPSNNNVTGMLPDTGNSKAMHAPITMKQQVLKA